MAFSHVQGDPTTGASSGSTSALAITVASTTGNNLGVVGSVLASTSRTVSSVTDDKSNSWSSALGPIDGGATCRAYQHYAVLAVAAVTTVTVNIGGGTSAVTAGFDEFSGNATSSVLGTTGSGTGTGTSPTLSGAITPTAGNLVVASTGGSASLGNPPTAGSGYTLGGRVTNGRMANEYKLSATTSENPGMTTSSVTWAHLAAEYVVPAGGGQPTMRRWGGVPGMMPGPVPIGRSW